MLIEWEQKSMSDSPDAANGICLVVLVIWGFVRGQLNFVPVKM